MRADGDKRRDADEHMDRLERLQERPSGHFGIAAWVPSHSKEMHGHKNGVYADKGEPEVDLTDPFMHKAAKHFREPEIKAGKHSEDRRYAHDQVEVRDDKVGVMKIQVQCRLRQEQSREAAAHEQ